MGDFFGSQMRNGLGLCPCFQWTAAAKSVRMTAGVERDRSRGETVDAGEVYGPKKTLYNRFVGWTERGIGEAFSAEDAPDRLFIHFTCIKVHRCAGGGKGEDFG